MAQGPVVGLWIRAKFTGDAVLIINGKPYVAQKLGHNAAQKRGYHPYFVQTDIQPTDPLTLTISSSGTLTRCLRLDILIGSAVES